MNPVDFDPQELDSILRSYIETSRQTPLVLEVFNDYIQYFLFMREGQLYWAGIRGEKGFEGVTIRRFLQMLKRTQYPRLVVYSLDLILYHSLLIYLQKKPELKISSTLVDLDDLLDKTEKDYGNALITANQPGNLIMLRYREGIPVACFQGLHLGKNTESSIREDFLVKVYTMSARSHFEINLYTDMIVSHSEDARPIPAEHFGTISSFFLSDPPKLIVKLKNRPLKTYSFTGKQLTVGRLQENDIVIDNLSVSRQHAVIISSSSGYLIRDLSSKNGTFLNGDRIDSAALKNGDSITIGKYQIAFQIPTGEESSQGGMDQTVIIPGFRPAEGGVEKFNVDFAASREESGRLFRRSNNEEIPLAGEKTTIGKKKDCDIRLMGLFAPNVKVEIDRCGDDYVIHKTSGKSNVQINGEQMEEKILEEEDLIAIGSDEFIFKR